MRPATTDVLEVARQHGVGPADWISDAGPQEVEISPEEDATARERVAERRRERAAQTQSPKPRSYRRFRRRELLEERDARLDLEN